MNALGLTSSSLATDKLVGLTSHTKHRHVPSPVSPSFVAPPFPPSLSFGSIALAAAVARTATTREDAPLELLDGLQRSALIELETLLEDGRAFALKSHFQLLADTAGSQFAAKVGAGMTHLFMDALGYAWRANALCLSSRLDPHADFIYDGGNVAGHGVVLAEAHGSFAGETTAAKITSAARRKYIRQVKPHIAAVSPFGKVIHGYSIAFGSKPTAVGSFLSVSETRIANPRKKPGTPPPTSEEEARPEATATAIVLTTHRSNFTLIGAPEIADWIDWLRSADAVMPERNSVEFVRFLYAGRTYLTSMPWFWRPGIPRWWAEEFFDHSHWRRMLQRAYTRPSHGAETLLGWFAIEEKAGGEFLNSLSAVIRGGERTVPASISLPTFEPVGFGLSEGDRSVEGTADGDYRYALFRDGLALLGDPFAVAHTTLSFGRRTGASRTDYRHRPPRDTSGHHLVGCAHLIIGFRGTRRDDRDL